MHSLFLNFIINNIEWMDMPMTSHQTNKKIKQLVSKDLNLNSTFQKALPLFIQFTQYQKLINWVYEHLHELGYCHSTQYKAKVIIDFYLSITKNLEIENFQLLGISAIIVSLKQFQGFQYPYFDAVLNSGNQYTQIQIQQFSANLENQISTSIDFIVSPFDYVDSIATLNTYSQIQQLKLFIKLITMYHFSFGKMAIMNLLSGLYLFFENMGDDNLTQKFLEKINELTDQHQQLKYLLKKHMQCTIREFQHYFNMMLN